MMTAELKGNGNLYGVRNNSCENLVKSRLPILLSPLENVIKGNCNNFWCTFIHTHTYYTMTIRLNSFLGSRFQFSVCPSVHLTLKWLIVMTYLFQVNLHPQHFTQSSRLKNYFLAIILLSEQKSQRRLPSGFLRTRASAFYDYFTLE